MTLPPPLPDDAPAYRPRAYGSATPAPPPRADDVPGARALDVFVPTDPIAAASCWIGVFGMLLCTIGWLLGPVAIGLGVLALRKQRFNETRYGRGISVARAWIGIITGSLGLLVGGAITVIFVLGRFGA